MCDISVYACMSSSQGKANGNVSTRAIPPADEDPFQKGELVHQSFGDL